LQRVAVLGEDGGLLAAARSGDEASFERLIQPLLGVGFRLARAMLHDDGEAEDVIQDAMFRAWHSLHQVRSPAHVKPWFLTIVANRSRSIRKTRRWSEIRWPDLRIAWPSPADFVARREDLAEALRRLGPEERAVVHLRFYEDMSNKDVAEALGISPAAARTRIHRALRHLRIKYTEEDQ
jgi:RNA polymerase sigma-70 factor (ECF subfamily)